MKKETPSDFIIKKLLKNELEKGSDFNEILLFLLSDFDSRANKCRWRKRLIVFYEELTGNKYKKLTAKEQRKRARILYYNKNKKKINTRKNELTQERRRNDSQFRLSMNVRNNIYSSLNRNGYSKNSKTEEILGCSFNELKRHLERQFTKGMNWDNQGEWHIDHIYPVSLAKDKEHLLELNHYTNLQPLWAEDNWKKGNAL